MPQIVLPFFDKDDFRFIQLYIGETPFLFGESKKTHAMLMRYFLDAVKLDYEPLLQVADVIVPKPIAEGYKAEGMGYAKMLNQDEMLVYMNKNSGMYQIFPSLAHFEKCSDLESSVRFVFDE